MEVLSGKVVNYYRLIGVASIKTAMPLKAGDRVRIKGHITDFEQKVRSLQLRHKPVDSVSAGELVGLKVKDYVRKNDRVYKITA